VPAPLLTTKLFAQPVRPNTLQRPRLIQALETGEDGKLTLVSAPPGFGKTTLITSWLHDADNPFTWLSLDGGDNDPLRFLSYLVGALQKIDESIGRSTLALLGKPQLPVVDLPMTSLINDIAAVPGSFVLVLDDYQFINTQWIHTAIDFLLDHQPPNIHLVLITRKDPPISLSRLRVRAELTEIRADDLRFTVEEATAFLNQALGLKLSLETVAALESRTEGWIAGLQMASLAIKGALSSQDRSIPPSMQATEAFIEAFRGSHRYVIDYLVDEVLVQQPEEVRNFLYQTAILDRFTAPLCDAVVDLGDPTHTPLHPSTPSRLEPHPFDTSKDFIEYLELTNLFLIPLDTERQWYRYHQLFADFLRTELELEKKKDLHLKAAYWFETNQLLPEAVKHALESGNMEESARLVAMAADQTFKDVSFITLGEWLDTLPHELVLSSAELSIYKGLLLLLNEWNMDAVVYAQAAEDCLSPETPASLRGRLLSLKAFLALCKDDPESVIQISNEALDFLNDDDFLFSSLTLNILGQASEMQGDVAAAAEVYRQGALVERKQGNQLGAMVALVNLVLSLNELGKRDQAIKLCQQVIQEGVDQGSNEQILGTGIDVAWSLLSYEANQLDLAQDQARHSVELSRQADIADGLLWGLFNLAHVYFARGQIERMLETTSEAQAYADRVKPGALQATWCAALEAQVSLQQGDLDAVVRWAEAAELKPEDTPHHWYEFVYFVYTRLLLAQNRYKEAERLLAAMEGSAQTGGRNRKLITIYLLQAQLQQARGDTKQGFELVDKALRLAAPQDYRRAFLDEGQAIIKLLPQVRQAAPVFVDQILADAGTAELKAPVKPEQKLVEPLSERELEILRLIAAGRSNPEIADLLYLSLNTVKWHVKNLYGKLEVSNRIEAVARAQELNLL
jgi:LuxR family maltose regulon positive regulatory protein